LLWSLLRLHRGILLNHGKLGADKKTIGLGHASLLCVFCCVLVRRLKQGVMHGRQVSTQLLDLATYSLTAAAWASVRAWCLCTCSRNRCRVVRCAR
jgi:hypothetical protein